MNPFTPTSTSTTGHSRRSDGFTAGNFGAAMAWAFVFSLLLTLSGCSSVLPEGEEEDATGSVTVSFTLYADFFSSRDEGPTTRSEGSESERAIRETDLSIVCFNADGEYMATIYDCGKDLPTSDNGTSIPTLSCDNNGCYGFSFTLASPQTIVVAAIANYKDFIVENLPTFDSSLTFSALRDIKIALPGSADGNAVEGTPFSALPMYGEIRITPTATPASPEGGQYDGGQLRMVRSLAKIVVEDRMAEGPEIVAVAMPTFPCEGFLGYGENESEPNPASQTAHATDLQFTKSADGKSFYTYLPESTLGEAPDDPSRLITFTTSDNKTHSLWLAHYEDGAPASSDQPHWATLLRNHSYRFTITGITTAATEPEVTDDLCILWTYDAQNGKFANKYINFLEAGKIPGDDIPLLGWTNKIAVRKNMVYSNDYYPETEYEFWSCLLKLSNYNVSFDNLCYQLLPNPGDNMTSDGINLIKDDAEIIILDGISYCFLTSPGFMDNTQNVPKDSPYRIYWKGRADVEIAISNIDITPTIFTDNRNYNYFDFTFNKTAKVMKYEFYANDKLYMDGNIYPTDIFIREFDGEKRYVFYIN